jgi:hypothetical protein
MYIEILSNTVIAPCSPAHAASMMLPSKFWQKQQQQYHLDFIQSNKGVSRLDTSFSFLLKVYRVSSIVC